MNYQLGWKFLYVLICHLLSFQYEMPIDVIESSARLARPLLK